MPRSSWECRAWTWTASSFAWWPGRCPASSARSAGSCGSGSRRDYGARASTCRPWWKPERRPHRTGPTDATATTDTHLHLGPHRHLPGHLGDLAGGQAHPDELADIWDRRFAHGHADHICPDPDPDPDREADEPGHDHQYAPPDQDAALQCLADRGALRVRRSEEHTSELQ